MRETEHISNCKSCRAEIVFLRTKARKLIPVNAETVERDEFQFDPKKHKAHFATCPDADDFRK